MKKLYRHKTDGGAEYLCASPIKKTNEGDLYTAVVRLDGQPEFLSPPHAAAPELLETLKNVLRELEWLNHNALIKSRAGGDYIEVECIKEVRAVIAKAGC